MTLKAMALSGAVKDEAARLGFDAAAIGPATPPPHGEAFERWLDDGCAGTMDYLSRSRRERLDPGALLPGARAAVAVALSYRPDEEAPEGADGMRIARYAGGRDYHDVIRPRLEALGRFIESAAGPDVRSRAAIDTSAVLERDLAARAGLGWFGKNTNLLTPSLGSWFFIGIVLTTAELDFDVEIPDRCGTCTACLDACPTAAFSAPYVLDARRCISYLTIELRGDIDESLHAGIGEWGFGCDVCQEVCPWNRKAAVTREPAFAAGPSPSPADVLGLDDVAFRERFRTSALWRARRSGLLRNAAIVLGNRGGEAAAPVLRGALTDPDPVVRRAASSALSRVTGTGFATFPAVGVVEIYAREDMMDQHKKGSEPEDRNEAETGQPLQLDEKQEKNDKSRQNPQHQGAPQHQGNPQHQAPQHQNPQHQPGGRPDMEKPSERR